MWNKILILIKEPYRKVVNSIAFYPVIFTLFFFNPFLFQYCF